MNQKNLDFKGVKRLLEEKEEILRQVDKSIFGLLVACENPTDGSEHHLSQQLDEKRYLRNKYRSEYLDLEHQMKLLKRRFFESRLIEAIAKDDPSLFFKIEEAICDNAGADDVEKDFILQQRAMCYRKLENAFKDQSSMIRQKHLAFATGKDDAQWEARLEHALAKSKRYFARQCGKIKYFRDRLLALSHNEHSHQFYLMAVQVLGHDKINEMMDQSSIRAA